MARRAHDVWPGPLDKNREWILMTYILYMRDALYNSVVTLAALPTLPTS